MEILVCIKEVPDDSVEIPFSESLNGGNLEVITPVVNAFDTYSLEMATQFKEAVEGEITVLSVGSEEVKNSLKNCLAVGGDYAYLVKEDKYQELDPLAIAKILAKAIKEIENIRGKTFDIIFTGKETTDYISGQVGIMLSDELKLPVVTDIIGIEKASDVVNLKHETDEGYEVIESVTPCVVTVSKPNYDPRYPTIKSKMAARKKPIEELNISEEFENNFKIVKAYAPKKREAGVKIKAETAEEAVAEAIAMMKEAKVF